MMFVQGHVAAVERARGACRFKSGDRYRVRIGRRALPSTTLAAAE